MKINKITHFLCVALFAVMLGSCSEANKEPSEPRERKLSAEEEKIEVLLSRAGTLQTAETKKPTYDSISSDISEEYITNNESKKVKVQKRKTTMRVSAIDNPLEFVTFSPWDILWPGSLIQGGSLRDGVPANIPIYSKRKLGRIVIPIVSGDKIVPYKSYREIEMRPSTVTQAMNELLAEHLKSQPAQIGFEAEIVSSTEQLALKLGINLDLFGASLKSTFGSGWSKNKNYVAVKLNQIFYRMDYENPDGGFFGVFTDDITAKDLENYTGPNNPICYVSSVAYGRSYIALYESSKDADSLHLSVTAAYKKQSGSVDLNLSKIFNNAKCTLLQLGGDPKAGLESVFGNFEAVQKFAIEGAIASPTNIGTPISYTIRHLKDNSIASLTNTLEYNVTETEIIELTGNNDVVIDIFNARFSEPKAREKGHQVSNRTGVRLKKMTIQHGEPGKMSNIDIDIPIGVYPAQLGANIPIYRSVKLEKVPKNHDIMIQCEAFIDNHTWKSWVFDGTGRLDGSASITMTNLYSFNENDNRWEGSAVDSEKKTGQEHVFDALMLTQAKIGPALSDVTVNIRFRCDGERYTMINKNKSKETN